MDGPPSGKGMGWMVALREFQSMAQHPNGE